MLTEEELEKCENPYEKIAKMAKDLFEEMKDEDIAKKAKGLDKETKDREYNRGYEKGLKDCWEMMKKIHMDPIDGGMYGSDLIDIFGYYRLDSILKKFSAKEAKEKIDNYIQKKNAELHVGDEVEELLKKMKED